MKRIWEVLICEPCDALAVVDHNVSSTSIRCKCGRELKWVAMLGDGANKRPLADLILGVCGPTEMLKRLHEVRS